jgi:hypothetical protein
LTITLQQLSKENEPDNIAKLIRCISGKHCLLLITGLLKHRPDSIKLFYQLNGYSIFNRLLSVSLGSIVFQKRIIHLLNHLMSETHLVALAIWKEKLHDSLIQLSQPATLDVEFAELVIVLLLTTDDTILDSMDSFSQTRR